MPLLTSLTQGVKGFFVEEAGAAPAPPPAAPAAGPAPSPMPAAPLAGLPAGAPQPEQRHLDHLAQLLAGDGRDFGAFVKLVKSLAGSGLGGPLLYQTAFHAFAALTGTDRPALLASADALAHRLADDRARVQARHREKLGDVRPAAGPLSALAQLREQESKLQATVEDLTRQLTAKSQQLADARQRLGEERARAQATLASYELAHAATVAELQAHHQALAAAPADGAPAAPAPAQ